MTDDLQQARVEAAAKALRDDKANRTDTYKVPAWEDTNYGDKLVLRGQARAALAAADAHLPSVEAIADAIEGAHKAWGEYWGDFQAGLDDDPGPLADFQAEAVRAMFGEVAGDE